MSKIWRSLSIIAAIAAVLLTACGGGGSDDTQPKTAKIELNGLYQGKSSTDDSDVFTLATSDGKFLTWIIRNGDAGRPYVTAEGTLISSSDQSLNSNSFLAFVGQLNRTGSTRFFIDDLTRKFGEITIEAIKYGFADYPSAKFTFSLAELSGFVLKDTPVLSETFGNWTSNFSYGGMYIHANKTITINSDGSIFSDFTIPSSGLFSSIPCSMNGKIIPASNGNNYFQVEMIFSNLTACPLAGKTVSGVVLNFINSEGKSQLTLISREEGIYFSAER